MARKRENCVETLFNYGETFFITLGRGLIFPVILIFEIINMIFPPKAIYSCSHCNHEIQSKLDRCSYCGVKLRWKI